MTSNRSELCYLNGTTLRAHIQSKELSAIDVVQAHLDQISNTNEAVNAICTKVPEDQALNQAANVDKLIARGENPGPLAGLPIAIKDLVQTRGIRTTMGLSLIHI